MSKRFWILTILLVVGFFGFIWLAGGDETPDTSAAGNAKPPTHIIGKQDAAVSLIEYSDFQCPACAAYYPVIEQVLEKYKDKHSFYLNTPKRRYFFVADGTAER